MGFRGGGTYANLNTAIVFEILPPIADDTVGIQSFTCHRIVGSIFLMHQSGIVSNDTAGVVVGVESVGADQTSDDPFLPTTTDTDALAHKGVMWWWTGQMTFGGPIADSDVTPYELKVDITVKRKVDKRQRLVISCAANTTGRLRILPNVRALIRETVQ